jgi:REP element-mobilizing transposase RayT
MEYSEIGQAACECWCNIAVHRPYVELDEWVIMPNHMHGIIHLKPDSGDATEGDATSRVSTDGNRFSGLQPRSLQSVVHAYKASVTRWCRAKGNGHFAWQERFHDHIIRSEVSLNAIRAYIRNNPANWREDTEYCL